MTSTTRSEEIVLIEPVSVFVLPGIGGRTRFETRAVAGRYRAEREDSQGVYYFGEGRPILKQLTALSDGRPLNEFTSEGGIFLPKDGGSPPRFFTIFETGASTAKSLNDLSTQQSVQAAAMPPAGTTPVTAGVGAAVGVAAVGAMLEAAVGQVQLDRPIEDPAAKAAIYAGRRLIGASSTSGK